MVKWIIFTILLLPMAEIAAFVVVAAMIGLGWAFLLMLGTTAAGYLVLRSAGRGRIARFRVAVSERNVTGFEADISSFLRVLAGLLLFLPGFVTDLAGAMLLLRPIRRRFASAVRNAMAGVGGGRNSVIDLDPEEWRQMPDRNGPDDRDRLGRN
jgi:UPF0716 protein FxsA